MIMRCAQVLFHLAVLVPAIACGQQTPRQTPKDAPAAATSDSPLLDYVAAPDDNFRWELRETLTVLNCDVLRLHLTSQSWHNVPWKHVLYLIKPPSLAADRQDAVMVVGGGSWRESWPENGPEQISLRGEAQLMANVATQFGCIIAVVTQVPFQPILDGKYEDEIIAATFAKYIETQDPTWPLLLPMVKSVVRAMDATTEATKEHWNADINQFTVTGASKRGWTTWLTAAVDGRVTAMAPMVIDMLNMGAQMKHQIDTWGDFSEQISDYTDLRLPEFLNTPRGEKLRRIVDPFSYREELSQPKLLIFGTNDRYWPLDACNLYWEQLPGQKHLLYVPNQGHGIDDYARVIGSVSALHRSLHGGSKLPGLDWSFMSGDKQVKLNVVAAGEIDTVRGWVANSPTRDFRDARWRERPCVRSAEDQWALSVTKPGTGFVACFAEAVCIADDVPSFFSTNVKIYPAD